jgi:regulator of protease activity HflC (stomatin/prohibitin superfamily)
VEVKPVIYVLLAVIVIVIVGFVWLRYKLAIPLAIRAKRKTVNMFCGTMQIILWEENEGLLLLKNKKLMDVIYGSDPATGGGTRMIYPILGEEVRVRVPLSLQLSEFKDNNVLTRESIRVRIRIAIWWRVCDIKRYYYSISDNVSVRGELGRPAAPDQHGGKPEIAERWVLTLAESTLRTMVSQANIAALVSTTPSGYLNVDQAPTPTAVQPQVQREKAIHEVMAGEMLAAIRPKVADYGLEVDRIEIQEVALLQEIQDAIDRVWRASLLPAQTQQEARAKQIELQSAASVIGTDVVALTEILKSYRPTGLAGSSPADVAWLLGALKGQSVPTPVPQPSELVTRQLIGVHRSVKVGEVYDGVVRAIKDYGAFVELSPGVSGLIHISEIDTGYVRRVEDFLSVEGEVRVKVLAIHEDGKIALSRKAALVTGKSMAN